MGGAPESDRLAPVAERSVIVDGVRTAFLHAGPRDSDEAVVFVHGNPGPAEDWRRLVARVGPFARAVAPDLPGFGDSEQPDRFVYTVDGYARHLGALLDRLGVRRAHLVLHDLGGPWGLSWAADHPDRLASVVLIDAGILRGYRWHYLARIWRTSGAGEAVLRAATRPAARMMLRHGNPRGLPRDVVERLYGQLKDPGVQRAVLRFYRATDLAAVSEDLDRRLEGVDRPALVVWGRQDPYFPVRYAERQRETFPGAYVVVLDDSGHWPMVDNPVALEQVVLPFLSAVTAPAGAAP
jgi:pimeloyl-ACP methyl ester carboxylesterase